ncbi:uncharacterized protein J3R85_020021 [Psidium guajava]|nr:uncharacterized protein J3R85_020021 [Psidium guajava]
MAPNLDATIAPRSAAAMAPLQGQPRPWLHSLRSARESVRTHCGKPSWGSGRRTWGLPSLERWMEMVDMAELGSGQRDGGCDENLIQLLLCITRSEDKRSQPRHSHWNDEEGGRKGRPRRNDQPSLKRIDACLLFNSFELEPFESSIAANDELKSFAADCGGQWW